MHRSTGVRVQSRFGGNRIASQRRIEGAGVSAEWVRFGHLAEVEYTLSGQASYIALHDTQRSDGETFVAGLSPSIVKDLRGRMTFVPSGGAIRGWSKHSKANASYTAIYLNPKPADHEECDISNIPPLALFKDDGLRSTILKIHAVLMNPALNDTMYVERLSLLLMLELNRTQFGRIESTEAVLGGLTDRQVRRVIDYMEANLKDNISLSDLSNLLNLSRYHFIRAFKQATGLPPCQYLVARRIDRAKELLKDRDLSLSEVAREAGFNGVTQLSRALQRIVGMTPTAFRREIF
jgi:AraC family transcriptional regulator